MDGGRISFIPVVPPLGLLRRDGGQLEAFRITSLPRNCDVSSVRCSPTSLPLAFLLYLRTRTDVELPNIEYAKT